VSKERKSAVELFKQQRAEFMAENNMMAGHNLNRFLQALTNIPQEELDELDAKDLTTNSALIAKIQSFGSNDERLARNQSTVNVSIHMQDKTLQEIIAKREALQRGE
jgi:hypothetical protein